MEIRKVLTLALLFYPFKAFATIGTSCKDINVIYCNTFSDGYGLIAHDQSQSGLDATLAGGPAWVDQRGGLKETSVINATMSMVNPAGHFLFFLPNAGQKATTVATTLFDFSGNKPFMIFFIASVNNLNPPGANAPLIANCNPGVGGWNIIAYTTPNSDFTFNVVGLVEVHWQVGYKLDNNFHSYMLWRDPVTPSTMRLYMDGKFMREQTGVNDLASQAGAQPFIFSDAACNNNGEFSGALGHFQVWNASVQRNLVDGFAKAMHNKFFGTKTNIPGALQ